ncbi:MAG: apolipoprotein N-acyltransferase, partial [Rhizobacter sp.]|nr:apolipoprotein N-acyltransferase [Rhizobacter sp.]
MKWPSRLPRASKDIPLSAFTHSSKYRASIEARLRAWPVWLELLLALLVGAVHAQTFDGSDLWWLQIACVVLLAWRVMQSRASRAALIGLAFGTAWQVAGTWWMYISMHDYGGLPAWMAGLSVLLLSAFLSLYLAAAMALFAHFRCGSVTLDALRFGACWLLAEIARAVLFTGFPWAA